MDKGDVRHQLFISNQYDMLLLYGFSPVSSLLGAKKKRSTDELVEAVFIFELELQDLVALGLTGLPDPMEYDSFILDTIETILEGLGYALQPDGSLLELLGIYLFFQSVVNGPQRSVVSCKNRNKRNF